MALYEINGRMKQKRDTAANWEAKNPVILNGEIVLVDTNAGELRAKIGDGVKKYLQLPFSDEVLRNLITDKANKDEIPTSLKNPNALTFTGGQSKTYDGSSAVSVAIPKAYTLPIASTTVLGGVKVATKTDDMIRQIGADENGHLFVKPSSYYVTITQTDAETLAGTADKTVADIYDAVQNGYLVYGLITLIDIGAPAIVPLTGAIENDGVIAISFSTTGRQSFEANPMAISAIGMNDTWQVGNAMLPTQEDIPTSLKNPNAITFTGASTGTYDGSSALTINIPEGGADAYTQFTQVAVSLPLSGWTGSTTFTNTISISSVKADTIVIVSPAPSDKDTFAFSNIYCSAQAKGSLTFTAKTKPSIDLTANLIIVTLPEGATAAANTCSLTVAGWSSNTQTVSVEGMAADRIVIIGPVVGSIDVCKTNAVYCSAQGNGTLTFKCQTTPSVAITMNVIMI